MQIAYAVVVKSVRSWCREPAMTEVRKVEEKRGRELTLHARLGRQDKAGPPRRTSGPNRLSAHCFKSVSGVVSRRASGAWSSFSFGFKARRAVARDVRGRRGRTAYADASISTHLDDERISLLRHALRLPIVALWHATKTTSASAPARSATVAAERERSAGSAGCGAARPASSVRSIRPCVGRAAIPIAWDGPEREVADSMRAAVAPRRR